MPVPIDHLAGDDALLTIENTYVEQSFNAPLNLVPWSVLPYDKENNPLPFHDTKTRNLDIGVKSILAPAIKSYGQARLWNGVATDLSTGKIDIGGIALNTRFYAFLVEEHWLEKYQRMYANAHNYLPTRDFVKIGWDIGSRAIMQKAHEFALGGEVSGDRGTIVSNGLFRTSGVRQIVESEDLYSLTPIDLYRKIRGYIKVFRQSGLLRSRDIKLMCSDDFMVDALGKEYGVSVSGQTLTSETVGTKLLERRNNNPVYLADIQEAYELGKDWLGSSQLTDGTKEFLLFHCRLSRSPNAYELVTHNPGISNYLRVIGRTNIEETEFTRRFIMFMKLSEIHVENVGLMLKVEYPARQ